MTDNIEPGKFTCEQLPELPEPEGESRGCRFHTEAQIRAYALAALAAEKEHEQCNRKREVAPTAASDAIARSKRILVLVDDYHEKPTTDTRTALRIALMDEFEACAPTAPAPVEAKASEVAPAGLSDEEIGRIGFDCGLKALTQMLDEDQWANIEPRLFKFARTLSSRLLPPDWVAIGELVDVSDGHVNTTIAAWNEERYKLPAGTKLYAAFEGNSQQAKQREEG
jgi:hypothetical protein